MNVTAKAGDALVITEALTHGALPWNPKDRMRMILVLRYVPQYAGNDHIPESVKSRLAPETLELIAKTDYGTQKEIVGEERSSGAVEG